MEPNFTIKRIKQTKDLLNNLNPNSDEYLTMLLNSLLSLIILPVEEIKRKPREKTFNIRINDFYKIIGVTPIKFDPIKSVDKNGNIIKRNRTTNNFVIKLRNAIAHQNIKVNEIEGKTYITLFNIFKSNNLKRGIRDFEIKLSLVELRRLSLFIAESYLKNT